MSSNNIHEKITKDLSKQIKKSKKIRMNMKKEKDSIKKEKLRKKLKTAYKNLISKNAVAEKLQKQYENAYKNLISKNAVVEKFFALEKERTAFNTPASTPVKSNKNNGNNNVQPIKKKSRKK